MQRKWLSEPYTNHIIKVVPYHCTDDLEQNSQFTTQYEVKRTEIKELKSSFFFN